MIRLSYIRLILLVALCSTYGLSLAQVQGAYKCVDLDGTDDYVVISDYTALNSDSTIAVEAWIKADAYGSNSYDNSIFCKHGWGRGNQGYVLRCGSNGKLSFNIADASGTWREAVSSSIMKTGIWYHVAGTYDGDSINIYINGELVRTTLYTGSISPSSGLTCRIGDLAYGGGRQFDGMIDEVRVWSTDIDESTIKDWMCRKVTSDHPNYKYLAGNWKLDKDTGVVALEASGNGKNGTLTNGPTRSLSGAAIGDISAHSYTADDIELKTKFGDVVLINNIKNNPNCFHVFADYTKTQQGIKKGEEGDIDTTHYFGVFYSDTSARYDISYNYGNLKGLTASGECGISLYTKESGFKGTWSNANASFQGAGDSLTLYTQTTQEFVTVFQETDSTKMIRSNTGKFVICGTDSLQLIATGNDSFSYVWYRNDKVLTGKTKQKIYVDSAADYKVTISRNSTSCTFTSANITVTKASKPSVSLAAFADVCESVDTVILNGASPSGGLFTGLDVKDSFFFPSKVGSGNYDIEYSFTDTNNCRDAKTKTLTVNALPRLRKSGNQEFCSNNDSVFLNIVTPNGGEYIGTYYSNNYLHIDSASYKTGFYPFVYEYTDGNGCSNTLKDSIEVKWATPCTLLSIPQACLNDDGVKLKGSPSSGQYLGKGVSNDTFVPSSAGVGKHAVIYAFTNALNCTSYDTQYVDVIANGAVSWSEKVDKCLNSDSLQLAEGSPKGGYFTGRGLSATGSFKPRVAGSGTHYLGYVSIDGNGCHNKATIAAVVHDTTNIIFSGTPSICLLADPIAMNLATPAGGTYTGMGIQSDTLYPINAGYGTHTYRYDYTDGNGCSSTATSTFEIFKPDSISILAKQLLCTYDDPVVLNIYPKGGTLSGKGIIGSVFSPDLAGAGTHTLKYSLTDNQGCPNQDSLLIVVAETPVVNLTQVPSFCLNDDAIPLTIGQPADSGVYKVNNVASTEFNPGLVGVGQHQVTYTIENYAGCIDSASISVRVNPLPVKPTIGLTKNTLVSSANSGNQWYGTGGLINGETNKLYSPTVDGSYWVAVTNDSGCTAKSDTFEFAFVGVVNTLPTSVKLYPNPSKDGVYTLSGLSQNTSVEIHTLDGRHISHTWNAVSGKLQLDSPCEGVYMLIIRTEMEAYATRLIIGL